jgi:hypothetical protein
LFIFSLHLIQLATEDTEENKIKSVDAKDAEEKKRERKEIDGTDLEWSVGINLCRVVGRMQNSHRIQIPCLAFLCALCVLCGQKGRSNVL